MPKLVYGRASVCHFRPTHCSLHRWSRGCVPSSITFSSVCERIEGMPVGFALCEQVLGSVSDVLDQALRLFFGCRRLFQSCRRFVLLAADFLSERKTAKSLAGRRFQVWIKHLPVQDVAHRQMKNQAPKNGSSLAGIHQHIRTLGQRWSRDRCRLQLFLFQHLLRRSHTSTYLRCNIPRDRTMQPS